ncbi:MAG TPA: tRNA (adenosine(37)-N6)-threonylcarbamoyltransferase complex ATPase subunit type 1 TsaE [Vicinamibacteria bacterium]|nr:tRNA (adenosine(37)-N6)-threonylcarbamoyltransferase complex ATPase subunit type 1 TsaE [Vicinamibacteria bacterium]
MTRTSRSPEETIAIAEELASEAPARSVYYLEGDLGAGKTTFTKGLAKGYGIDPAIVSSPTFALVNRYSGGTRDVYHIDLYRIENERELVELGLEELEEEGAVLVVEWPEKLGRFALREAVRVQLEMTGENERRITIRSGVPK